VGDTAALPGSQDVAVDVFIRHDQPVHAFSLALRFREDALSFSRLDLDSPDIITGQIGYEYSRTIVDNEEGYLVVAVLLDYESPYDFRALPPSPDEDQLVARLIFDVHSEAVPGVYPVQPRSGIGDPPVDNVLSVAGTSVLPELQPGNFRVVNPNQLRILDSQALPGGRAVVYVEAEHLDPIGGYTVVIRYPSDVLTIDTDPLDDPQNEDPFEFVEEDICKWPITFCGMNLEDYLGTDGPGKYPVESFTTWAVPDYNYGSVVPGTGSGRVFAAAIFDMVPPNRQQTLPAGKQRILKIIFNVSGTVTVGEEIPLTLVNETGDPPLDNIFLLPVPDEPVKSVRPDLFHGKVTIVEGFRRGFINPTDNRADLADVIYLLGYLFADKPAPPCMKAADTNDDGKLDIADAILLLGYFFRGDVKPAEPFESCGGDPTPDNLTCDTPVGCLP